MKKITILLFCILAVPALLKAQNDTEKKVEIPKLTTDEFYKKVFDPSQGEKATYKGKIPCIVDFYADWCRPCRMMQPILEEIQKEYEGKIIIYKVNVDQEKALATAFQVTGIPMLLFVPKKGQSVAAKGFLSKEELIKYIETYLKP